MGIQLDFVSSDVISSKSSLEKIDFIIEKIKNNVIVILEEGLSPKEEAELIETTMREIDVKDFHGIEFYRIDHKEMRLRDRLANYISGRKTGMTIVGPTRMVEAIKKESDGISVLAKAMKGTGKKGKGGKGSRKNARKDDTKKSEKKKQVKKHKKKPKDTGEKSAE